MVDSGKPTESARVEEEIREAYREACDRRGLNYSEPIQEFVKRFSEEPEFQEFCNDLINKDNDFDTIINGHVESDSQHLDESLLEDGKRRVKAGLREQHEPMAYEGADRLGEAITVLGREVEEALDSIDQHYWEITR